MSLVLSSVYAGNLVYYSLIANSNKIVDTQDDSDWEEIESNN